MLTYIKPLFCISILFCSLNAFSAQFGTFMLVKGRVLIEAANGEQTEAKVNSRIFEGQTVITEVNSRAKIVMSDRNVIIVQPETRLKIEKYKSDGKERNTSLNLIEGKFRVNVQKDYDMEASKFEVRTNTAVAGVRGTQFITSYDKQNDLTEVTTIEGKVELRVFSPGGSDKFNLVVVGAGERVAAEGNGKVGQVEKISNDEIKQIDNNTNIKDDDKRNQMNQKKNDDGMVVGGINNEPLRPKNNLILQPRNELVRPPVNDKTSVNVIIGN